MKIRNERLAAVAAGSAIVVLLGSVTAFAAGQITSKDIKNHTIQSWDISHAAKKDLRGNRGPQGPAGATYEGENWSIVDRNVFGDGDSYLRAGPDGAPYGIGSLGMRTGTPDDSAVFGNQVDFAGDPLSGLTRVEFDIYTTRENNDEGPNNLPSARFEVDPTGAADDTGPNYSTLQFIPESAADYAWTHVDGSTAQRWYYTGAAGTASGCNQTTYCTLEEAKSKYPNATMLTAMIGKGRDYFFSGAVDGLIINDKLYDFEPNGVITSDAPAAD